jgi:hypothetical protein
MYFIVLEKGIFWRPKIFSKQGIPNRRSKPKPRLLKPVLDHLTLGQDGIQYYAYGVIKAQIFQLTRRAERERYLHLIAFIAHQYYRLHDNLVVGN